jgi:hypothetical protein
MIKQLLTATFFSAAAIMSAQQLTNSGFENWTAGNPDNWGSFDQMLGFGTTLETQVTPGNSGASACQLQTQNVPFVGILPGVISSGPIVTSGTSILVKGAPFTGTPTDYTFYYKFTPVGTDTAGTEAIFTKWNTTTNMRDTIAYGFAGITAATSTFTLGSVPILWFGVGTPDSVTVVFISSATSAPQVNTTFIIDDVTMVYPLGIAEPFMGTYNVYPNPSNDHVTISCRDEKAVKAVIYDLTGREVANGSFADSKVKFNTSALPEGLYIYRVTDENGIEMKNGKITIAR